MILELEPNGRWGCEPRCSLGVEIDARASAVTVRVTSSTTAHAERVVERVDRSGRRRLLGDTHIGLLPQSAQWIPE